MSDDLTRLTDEERGIIAKALREAWRDNYSAASVVDGLCPAVESILAARTTALIDRAERAERERDELRGRIAGLERECDNRVMEALRDHAQESIARQADLQARLVNRGAEYEEAERRANRATNERNRLADELAALCAAVTGLADEWGPQSDDGPVRMVIDCANAADALRALLTDEGDNQ